MLVPRPVLAAVAPPVGLPTVTYSATASDWKLSIADNGGHHDAPRSRARNATASASEELLLEEMQHRIANESRPITVEVNAEGATVSSSKAVSIGLIVTEGVITPSSAVM
jgi:hypothetical protein